MDMEPLFFTHRFFTRIWGGRALSSVFRRELPDDGQPYGESWEISDRPEFASQVTNGALAGTSLNALWSDKTCREEIFGTGYDRFARFPLLCKILDARDTLSVQVHPPASVARQLGGESKTEAWYVASAEKDAVIYSGWNDVYTLDQVRSALNTGGVSELIHQIHPSAGDSLFIPSGRIHALGAGLLIYEIQENSDTTYRLFDWNRTDDSGLPRELHIEQSLKSIAMDDIRPQARPASPGTLVNSREFIMEQKDLMPGELLQLTDPEHFALVVVTEGHLVFPRVQAQANPGDFFLIPRHGQPGTAGSEGAKLLFCIVPSL